MWRKREEGVRERERDGEGVDKATQCLLTDKHIVAI